MTATLGGRRRPVVRVTDELLDRMIRALVDEVDPEQVILFGCRARGEERARMDVDLLVVEAEGVRPGTKQAPENEPALRGVARIPPTDGRPGLLVAGRRVLARFAQPRSGAGTAGGEDAP